MFWQFIKYWGDCILIALRFGYYIFSCITGVSLLVSAGLFLCRKYYQETWKRWRPIIMKMAFYLFVISVLVAFFVAPYKMHTGQQETITAQQEEIKKLQGKQDIKQEIRVLLDKINKEILPILDEIYKIDPDKDNRVKIDDDGKRYVRVFISLQHQNKLWNLSEHPDFDKFLIYTKCDKFRNTKWDKAHTGKGYIFDLDQSDRTRGYDFWPKGALKR